MLQNLQKLAFLMNMSISQINLIMFFGRFNCEQYGSMERINTRKRNTAQFSVQSVKITFMLFKSHRSIDIPIDFFLSCHEKAHDNKEFSHENLKPCRESRITTHQVKPCQL